MNMRIFIALVDADVGYHSLVYELCLCVFSYKRNLLFIVQLFRKT